MDIILASSLRDSRREISRAIYDAAILPTTREGYYLQYSRWYYQKVVPKLFDSRIKNTENKTGSREILLLHNGVQTEGIMILKDEEGEKKICTFFLQENARKKGYGSLMMEKAFEILKCEKPIMTVATGLIDEFNGILEKYSFEETGRQKDQFESDLGVRYYQEEILFNS